MTVSCRYFSYKASRTHVQLMFFFSFPDVPVFLSLQEESSLILVIYFGLTLQWYAASACLCIEGFHTLWSWGLYSHFIKWTANVFAQHNDCCALKHIIYWPNSGFLSFTVTVLYWCPEQQPLAEGGGIDAVTGTNPSINYEEPWASAATAWLEWRCLKVPEILWFYSCVLLFPLI